MEKQINLLFTSVGRRSYLLRYFREALNGEGKIYATNSDSHSTAFKYADDHKVSPLIYSEEYIPFLLDCCKKWNITAIISLFDIDLMILAKNKKRFEEMGVTVIVSEEEVISVCNDKWNTYNYLKNNNIDAPKTYLNVSDVINEIKTGAVNYPLIVKPRWGMGSIGVFEADNEAELKVFFEKIKNIIKNSYLKYESEYDYENCVIIQEKIKGQEYGLDVINDLQARHINTIVKKKIAMRAGETDCALVEDNDRVKAVGEEIGKKLRHIGNLDVDVMADGSGLYVIEMNARFGGGYPFSHLAGVNLPKVIVNWLKGEDTDEKLLVAKAGILAQKEIDMAIIE